MVLLSLVDAVDLSFIQSLCESSTLALLVGALEKGGESGGLLAQRPAFALAGCAFSFVGVFGVVLACFHLKMMKHFLTNAREHAQGTRSVDALARLIASSGGGLVALGFNATGGGGVGVDGDKEDGNELIHLPVAPESRTHEGCTSSSGDSSDDDVDDGGVNFKVGTDELRSLRIRASAVIADDGTLEREGWELIMNRRTDGMRYRAWRRDLPNGLTEYRSSTLIRGLSPEDMNELYLDDENRQVWDFCFRGHDVLEDNGNDGDVVRWMRKLPVCPPRDYILARRSFVVDNGDICTVTRTTEHPRAPRQEKVHRVDRFYSSWVCRSTTWTHDDDTKDDDDVDDSDSDDAFSTDEEASSDAEQERGQWKQEDGGDDATDDDDTEEEEEEAPETAKNDDDDKARERCMSGQQEEEEEAAAETVLIHCEDLSIPRDIAKFVIRQGMWRMVRKIEGAARAYAADRASRGDVPRPGITSICRHPAAVFSERPVCSDVDGSDASSAGSGSCTETCSSSASSSNGSNVNDDDELNIFCDMDGNVFTSSSSGRKQEKGFKLRTVAAVVLLGIATLAMKKARLK